MSSDVGSGTSVRECLPWCCCCFICVGFVALLVGLLTSPALQCFAPTALNLTRVNDTLGVDGSAVALTCAGEYAAVGVASGDGLVEVARFNFNNSTYNSSQTLLPPDSGAAGMFGGALASDCRNGLLVVGEPAYAASSGRVHVYARSDVITDVSSDYAFVETHANPGGALDAALFGHALAFACRRRLFVVGAPLAAGGDGAVYVYEAVADATNAFALVESIAAPLSELTPMSQFGAAVALSCDGLVMAVGAPHDDGDGSVLLYVRANASLPFAVAQRLTAVDALPAQTTRNFGASVALARRGALLVAGAPLHDVDGSLEDAGLVRTLLAADGRTPGATPYTAMTPDVVGTLDGGRFGASLAANYDGAALVVGSSSPSVAGNVTRLLLKSKASGLSYSRQKTPFGSPPPPGLGAGVASSFAGAEYASTSAASSANSTRIGLLGCSKRTGAACPAC